MKFPTSEEFANQIRELQKKLDDFTIELDKENEMEKTIYEDETLMVRVFNHPFIDNEKQVMFMVPFEGVKPIDIEGKIFTEISTKWLDLQGYDVLKRELELLQCPFCGGECYTWNPAENDWSVACQDCTYNSGCADSESEAIRLHNLIVDNALSQEEE